MITALRTAIWNEGFKPATGQHEVLLAAGALALTETGPGSPSLGAGKRAGPGRVLAALAAGSAAAISIGRREQAAPAQATPAEERATSEPSAAPTGQ